MDLPPNLIVRRDAIFCAVANTSATFTIPAPGAGLRWRLWGVSVAPNVSNSGYAGWKAIVRPATGSVFGRLDLGGAVRTGYQLLVPGGVAYPTNTGVELIASVDVVPDSVVFNTLLTEEAA